MKHPAFTAVAIAGLAVGICVNTAVFTMCCHVAAAGCQGCTAACEHLSHESA
jgi:hypothetical protein